MSRPSPLEQSSVMATDEDSARLAGWGLQEGYSPFIPPPGMVAHGHFPSINDPIPMYNFGQFHTPEQNNIRPAQNINIAQQAPSHPYQNTYEQSRVQEPQSQFIHHFQGQHTRVWSLAVLK